MPTPEEEELTDSERTARFIAIAICTMENPPSWDEALRIGTHLVEEKIIKGKA